MRKRSMDTCTGYLDGFGKLLIVFVQKYLYPYYKKKKKKKKKKKGGGAKNTSWRFLKNALLSKNPDDLNRLPVKFLF